MSEPDVDQELLARVDNQVLWLTLNRPDAGNAITPAVRNRIIEHLGDASARFDVRAVVLTGTGEKHFCTGADLRAGRANPPPPPPDGMPERLTGDAARLIQVFVRRGLIPDGGPTYLLPRLVGLQKAKELVFFGDDLPAAEAERIGLVNKVVPAAELQSTARAWAERLAQGPTRSIAFAKQLLNRSLDTDRASMFEQESMIVELIAGTHDSAEGVASFVERRPTEFKGY